MWENKTSDFMGIFRANFTENLWVRNGQFHRSFLVCFHGIICESTELIFFTITVIHCCIPVVVTYISNYQVYIIIIVIFSHLCTAVIRRGDAEIEAQTSKRGVPVKAETFAERCFLLFCNFTFVIDIETAFHPYVLIKP